MHTDRCKSGTLSLGMFFFWLMMAWPGYGHDSYQDQYAFIPNMGQWPENVLYKADLPSGAMFVERNGFLFVYRNETQVRDLVGYKFLEPDERTRRGLPDLEIDHFAFRCALIDAASFSTISEEGKAPYYLNYFLGEKESSWAGGVYPAKGITIHKVYPGVDMVLSTEQGNLKYAFRVAPGSDPAVIRMAWEHGGRIRIARSGNLLITTPLGELVEQAPKAWTMQTGFQHSVPCHFSLEKNIVSFALPEGYSVTDTLVIDPTLVFASYSGSTIDNWGYSATYDEDGFLYAAGVAFGTGYPVVTGSYQVNFAGGGCDIAISKYDTTGSFLVYSTYLGGSGTDVPSSLVVNNSNELVLLGTTGSSNYPVTSGAYDQTFNGGLSYTLSAMLQFPNGADIILSRFNVDGTQLLSSTYFGGFGNDGLNGHSPLRFNYGDDVRGEIVVDEIGNVYVCSSTNSSNLPGTASAFQSAYGGGAQDACIFKMNRDLGILFWASYLGGSGLDAGYSLVLGPDQQIYAAGGTTSQNMPGMTGYQTLNGGGTADGFIVRISANGQTLIGGTYVGGPTYDQVFFVKSDRNNDIYVLGQTSAPGNIFIQNVSWSVPGGGQFISKYNPGLNARIWSTAWGTGNGGPDVSPSAFMVDVCFNVYLSAWGGSALNGFGGTAGLPVTPDAFQLTTDGKDYYFLVLDKNISQPIFATYYGGASGEHVDGGTSRFDRRGAIYQAVCAGCGGLDDFPTTPGAWSNTNNATNCNNAVVKIRFDVPFLIADFQQPVSGCAPYVVDFQNTSQTVSASGTTFHWDFGDGFTSTASHPVHTYTSSGIYQVRLVVSDAAACNQSDTVYRYLVVLSNKRDTLPTIHLCPGEITMLGIPPTPDPGITYAWSPPGGLSNTSVSNPIANTPFSQLYELIVSNGSCADTLQQLVDVHIVQVDAGTDTAVCHSTLTLQATGNNPSLFYHWSSNPDFTDTLNTSMLSPSATVSITSPRKFYVKAHDGYCVAIDSIHVDFLIVIAPLWASMPTCHAYCDGSLIAYSSGGTPPYTYLWSDGQTGDTAVGLCAGTYAVTITDSQGCVAISTGVLPEPAPVQLQATLIPVPCEEVCIGQIQVQASGGMYPYSYAWGQGQTTPLLTNLCAGAFELLVLDAHGCPARDTFEILVESPFDTIQVYPHIDTIFKGQEIRIMASVIPQASYQWQPAAGLDNPTSAQTMAAPVVPTTYYLTITDIYGCIWQDSVVIFVKELVCDFPYIYVPNAFTPNGDGQNDVLYVRSSVGYAIRFVLFDRWGEKVFETTDPDEGWNGIFRGKPCDPGVFVYHLDVTCFDGQRYSHKGNITLLR
ncbi:MAG: gliding motility-associated C-terminal domain-containing protein [Lentimicrobiaceae bacterium]|nr:gliding motility-associated C-terminal domain-containing protein [Lentimicrobiaceae bacterium]